MVLNAGGIGRCGWRIACCKVWMVSGTLVRILPWPVCLRNMVRIGVGGRGHYKAQHGKTVQPCMCVGVSMVPRVRGTRRR